MNREAKHEQRHDFHINQRTSLISEVLNVDFHLKRTRCITPPMVNLECPSGIAKSKLQDQGNPHVQCHVDRMKSSIIIRVISANAVVYMRYSRIS